MDASKNLIRLPRVLRMTGKGRSTIYRDMAAGRFPQSVKIGARAAAWIESEVQDWIQRQVESSRAGDQ